MTRTLTLYLLPLLLAFSAIVAMNEYARGNINKSSRKSERQMKINSAVATPVECTWNCYNDTSNCKRHHMKLLSNYVRFIDPIYFGMIKALLSTGNYGAANVLFLVILWPLLISYLLVKPLLLQIQIRKLNKRYV